jgi:hypothetical protein
MRSGTSTSRRTVPTRCIAAAVLITVALLTWGCASTGTPGGAPPVETMSPGWQSRVSLHWRVVEESAGTRRVTGYVQNHSPNLYRVRLLVKSLDASGAVVGRRVQSLFGELPPFERDFFDVAALPAADHYEVSVYTLDKVPGLEG